MNVNSQSTFISKYLYIDVNANEGDITFKVDPAFYKEDNYVFELMVEERVIQSVPLTKAQLQNEVRIIMQDVAGFIDAFTTETQLVTLSIREPDPSSESRREYILVCNPISLRVLYSMEVDDRDKVVVIFDNNSVMIREDYPTSLIINDNIQVRIKPINMFYKPQSKIESYPIDMDSLLDNNKIELFVENDCLSFGKIYENIIINKSIAYPMKLAVISMIDRSSVALIDCNPPGNEVVQLFINNKYLDSKTEKDPIINKYKFDIDIDDFVKENYYTTKIVNSSDNVLSYKNYYIYQSSIIERVKVKKLNNCYAKIDYKFQLPISSYLNNNLILHLNGEEQKFEEISYTEFSFETLICKIKDHYNELTITVMDTNGYIPIVKHKESIFFHKSHIEG